MPNRIAALILLALATPASACSCIALAPESFRAQADVILYGRVLSVVPQGNGMRARIRVLHAVKGQTARIISVQTPPHSAACGVEMVPGRGAEYLLKRLKGGFSTNSCLMIGSRTR